MKIGTKGSFGIPEEMREQAERARKERDDTPPPVVEDAAPQEDEEETTPPEMPTQKDPMEVLADIGIEVKEEDFHSLIFRGMVEKILTIMTNPFSGKPFKAKLKTLTSEELDLVDELIATEMDSTKMTQVGYEARRAMWILSFAVVELDGNPLTKAVYDTDKTFLPKETAMKRRKVLAKLSPTTIDLIMEKHSKMVISYNTLMSGSKNELLKK